MDNLNSINGDIIVKFNGKQFNSNIYLLNTMSEFFKVIHKGHFKEKDIINISFDDLLGSPQNPLLFEQFLKCCYTDNFNLTIFKSFVDVVEYYRLLDYLQFVNMDKYDFVDYIHRMLNDVKPIGNIYDNIISEYCQTFREKNNCKYYISVVECDKYGDMVRNSREILPIV